MRACGRHAGRLIPDSSTAARAPPTRTSRRPRAVTTRHGGPMPCAVGVCTRRAAPAAPQRCMYLFDNMMGSSGGRYFMIFSFAAIWVIVCGPLAVPPPQRLEQLAMLHPSRLAARAHDSYASRTLLVPRHAAP